MQDPASGSWITYNGEIYNFLELREELEKRGRTFRSRSDTEVLLQAWAAFGEEALCRLRGMFAFAIYNPARGELLLARDPIGEKPLYYASRPGFFAFASEVRALLASGLLPRRLDPRGLGVYLYNGFLVDPVTLVEGVRALLPGHFLRVGADGTVRGIKRFWGGPLCGSKESQAPDGDALRARFEEAVRIRMVADVPLGAFLSGGLDSTAVVGAMAQLGRPPRTFTVTLPGSALDESVPAREAADRLRTEHYELEVGSELSSFIADAIQALDQPSFDGANTYLVARASREAGLTVALSGLGGDELFGGYPFLKDASRLARILAALGPLGRRGKLLGQLASLSGPGKLLAAFESLERELIPLACYQATQVLFPHRYADQLLQEPASDLLLGLPKEFVSFLHEENKAGDLLDQLAHLTLRLFCGQRTLRDADQVSMAVSLEVRPPFLDQLLVEETFRIPGLVRLKGIPDKAFERKLLGPLLPTGYQHRGKQGFVLPFADWLRPGGMLAGFARERLQDRDLLARAGLRAEGVLRLLECGDRIPWSRRWALVALLDWIARTGVEA